MANQYPNGPYTDVHCYDITGVGGNLTHGTGTYNNGTFSCGPFPQHDRPRVGSYYNLNGLVGNNRHEFPGWKCVNSGATSDFRER